MNDKSTRRNPVWNEDLQCNWYGLFLPADDVVVLVIKPLNATDMTGALKVAKAVLPEVQTVIVVAGGTGEIDVTYLLKEGAWQAFDPPKGAILKDAVGFGVMAAI